MINNVCFLGERNFSETNLLHLVNIDLNAAIMMDVVVVKEQRVLRTIAEVLLLDIPSSVLIKVYIIKVFGFELVPRLGVPHWMREVSALQHKQRVALLLYQ